MVMGTPLSGFGPGPFDPDTCGDTTLTTLLTESVVDGEAGEDFGAERVIASGVMASANSAPTGSASSGRAGGEDRHVDTGLLADAVYAPSTDRADAARPCQKRCRA